MALDKAVWDYIEYELYHYERYKKDIDAERERIIDASPKPVDGLPNGNQKVSVTEKKAIKLIDSVAILNMERVVKSIDSALSRLTKEHKAIFYQVYLKHRRDRYALCDELGIAEATFTRYKRSIIESVGKEMGLS